MKKLKLMEKIAKQTKNMDYFLPKFSFQFLFEYACGPFALFLRISTVLSYFWDSFEAKLTAVFDLR